MALLRRCDKQCQIQDEESRIHLARIILRQSQQSRWRPPSKHNAAACLNRSFSTDVQISSVGGSIEFSDLVNLGIQRGCDGIVRAGN